MISQADILKFQLLQSTVAIGYDIIICAGQSNMSGRGTPFSTTYTDPPDPRIYQFGDSGTYNGVISAAIEPLSHHDIPSGIGPAYAFSRWYVQTLAPSRRVLLVPVAHGGTGFDHTAGYTWLPGDTAVTNLFENMISQAVKALAAAGPNSRIVGALWLQGETDGSNNTSDTVYKTSLLSFIDNLRSRLSLPNLPFVIGQMVPEYLSTGTRAAINAVHIDAPRLRSNVGFAYGAVGQNLGDGNHYNAVGQRINGMNFFDAFVHALSNVTGQAPQPVPSPLVLSQVGTTLNVSWPRPYCRVTDYKTEYSTDGEATWTLLTRTQGLDPSAAITGLTLGGTVSVRVSTVNETGTAAPTKATITLASTPAQVTGLSVPAPSQTTITPTWNAVAGATSYQIQFKKHTDSTWTNGLLVSTNTGTFTLQLSSTQYDIQVYAINAAGNGTPSSTVTVTTGIAAGVLDTISVTPWAAYSLRKLRTAYAGSAIRVRRSSDNAEQDFGWVSGSLDFDGAAVLAFAGSGSAFIKTDYDQSGNGRDLTQTNTANQRRIVNAGVLDTQGIYNRPAPYFDGASSYTTRVGAGLYAAGAASIAVVASSKTVAASKYLVMEGSTAAANQQYAPVLEDSVTGAHMIAFIRNDANGTPYNLISGFDPPGFDGNLHRLETDDSGTSITTFVDSTQTVSIGYGRTGTLTLTNFSIGAAVRNTVGSYFNGYIPEVICWASLISATDKATLRADQKNYYGTN